MPMNEYGEIVRKQGSSFPSRRFNNRGRLVLGIIVGIIIALVISAIILLPIYIHYQKENINDLQTKLIGKEYQADNSHSKMLTNYRETWKFHFIDNNTLDYYYIDQYSWVSDPPKYDGTYSYTLSGPFFGEYKLKTHGQTFIIKVDNNNNIKSSWMWDDCIIHDCSN